MSKAKELDSYNWGPHLPKDDGQDCWDPMTADRQEL
jgi:hypothetical protein